MINPLQRPATYLGCGCGLLLAACGSANGSNPPSKPGKHDSNPPSAHDSKFVRTPWDEITRSKRPSKLLINTIQGTADTSSPCFIHYMTRVVSQTSHRISIELLAPAIEEDRPFTCTANAVRGPFLVPVHLKKRYRGQKLLDPATGRCHHLVPRSELS